MSLETALITILVLSFLASAAIVGLAFLAVKTVVFQVDDLEPIDDAVLEAALEKMNSEADDGDTDKRVKAAPAA